MSASSNNTARKLALNTIALAAASALATMASLNVAVLTQKVADASGVPTQTSDISRALVTFKESIDHVGGAIQKAHQQLELDEYISLPVGDYMLEGVGTKLAGAGLVDKVSFYKVMGLMSTEGLAGMFDNMADKLEMIHLGTALLKKKLEIAGLATGAKGFNSVAAEDGFDATLHQLNEAMSNFHSRLQALQVIHTETEFQIDGGTTLLDQVGSQHTSQAQPATA